MHKIKINPRATEDLIEILETILCFIEQAMNLSTFTVFSMPVETILKYSSLMKSILITEMNKTHCAKFSVGDILLHYKAAGQANLILKNQPNT